MLETFLDLLSQYGYPVVFLAAMFENVFLLGLVTPGQAVILAAAFASRFSGLDPIVVALVAAVGETIGNIVSYLFGVWSGPKALNRLHRRFGGRGESIDAAMAFIERHGTAALLLGRPAWGLKNILPAAAGAAGMPLWKAVLLVSASSAIYYPTLVAVGYALGFGVQEAAAYAAWFGVAVPVILGLIVFGIWLRARAVRRRNHPPSEPNTSNTKTR